MMNVDLVVFDTNKDERFSGEHGMRCVALTSIL